MNAHAASEAVVVGSVPFKTLLTAIPPPGEGTRTYAKLAEIEQCAYALWRSILTYRDTPAFPDCADYRERRMEQVLADIEDMHKALADV